jgi:hypothetical protein
MVLLTAIIKLICKNCCYSKIGYFNLNHIKLKFRHANKLSGKLVILKLEVAKGF